MGFFSMDKSKVLLMHQPSAHGLVPFLERAGYAVHAAEKPEDAAISLLEHEPEVVIWDVNLNRMSEWNRLHAMLKSRTPLVSVNQLKSWDDSENGLGADSVLSASIGEPHASGPNLSEALEASSQTEGAIDNPDALLGKLSQLLSKSKGDIRHFYTKVGNKLRRIELSDIRFIQVEGKYSTIHLESRNYHIKSSLNDMLHLLSSNEFVRVSRNNVVNLEFIEHIDVFQSTVRIGNDDVPISRTYKENLMRFVQLM